MAGEEVSERKHRSKSREHRRERSKEKRRRSRSRSRSKSRGRRSRSRTKEKATPQQRQMPEQTPQQWYIAQQLMQQQQQQNHQVGGTAERKLREVYVGNLAIGLVTSQVLTEMFNNALQYLMPEHTKPAAGTVWAMPVVSCQMDGSGKFAFVEFRTEEMATAALKLDRLELCGRHINVGRPKGYQEAVAKAHAGGSLPNLQPAGAAQAHQPASVHETQVKAARQFAEQISLQTGATEKSIKPAKPLPDEYFLAPCSRLLLIEGMVPVALLAAPGEREEVEGDAKKQCSRHAEVEQCFAPTPDPDAIRRRDLSRVYCLFETLEGARETRLRLHGRQYDVNRMIARCVDESDLSRALNEGWLLSHNIIQDEGTILITNLPPNVSPREVADFFTDYGVSEGDVQMATSPDTSQLPAARVTMRGEYAQARLALSKSGDQLRGHVVAVATAERQQEASTRDE